MFDYKLLRIFGIKSCRIYVAGRNIDVSSDAGTTIRIDEFTEHIKNDNSVRRKNRIILFKHNSDANISQNS